MSWIQSLRAAERMRARSASCHNRVRNHVSASDTETVAIQRFFLSSVPSRIAMFLYCSVEVVSVEVDGNAAPVFAVSARRYVVRTMRKLTTPLC